MNKKAVFFEVAPAEQEMLTAEIGRSPALQGWDFVFRPEKLTEKTAGAAADASVVSVFVNSQVTADVIARLPSVKLLVTRSTGFDHVDGAAAKARGIVVMNVPAYGSRTVAEYTFALILGLSRKTFEAVHRVKAGMEFDVYGLMGFDLQGKTLGIVGTGRIGQNVAQIARGFGMNIVAFDTHHNDEAATRIGFSYATLDEVLSRSDIVTLHVPFLPETKHLINMDNVKRFKKGALLVNTARGEICDTDAILYGVKNGILGGVGLDVIEGERRLKDDSAHLFTMVEDELMHPEQRHRLAEYRELMKMPEVYMTPHIAYFTKEAQAEISKTTTENIAAFAGAQMQNKVN